MNKIPIGVSQCLLGDQVRFDGTHKLNTYLTEVLGEYFDYRPFCPEMAIGLGVPRKPIRIVSTGNNDLIRGVYNPELDVTQALMQEADQVATKHGDICGYLFTQRSPSCGVFGVKRYDVDGNLLDKKGRGAFAGRLIQLMPLLPVEESDRLADPAIRDNFLTRVFAYHEWKTFVEPASSPGRILAFYSRYKYQIMAHHIPSYYAIGRLLSDFSSQPLEKIQAEFINRFMTALCLPTTRKGNTNTLMHLRGYLKRQLSKQEQLELSQAIEAYRLGQVPMAVPLKLLKQHLLKYGSDYLKQQRYWAPHPQSLGLRNFVME